MLGMKVINKLVKKWKNILPPKSRSRFLTWRITEEKNKLCPSKKRSLLNQLYFPSSKSILFIVVPFLLLFLLSHFLPVQYLPFISSNHYQNLITIHAGIATVIFGILIFVAESGRDDKTKEKIRVLLKESFIFPLAVAEILAFFIFIWGDVNFLSVIPIVIVGLLTIRSLYKTTTVLLSKHRFNQKRAELLKELLQKSIDLAIDERIGNNILLSFLDGKEIKLKFKPFSIDDQSKYYCFNAEKIGIVSDIDLEALKKFAEIIEQEANRKGYSFDGGEIVELDLKEKTKADSEIKATQKAKSQKLLQNDRRYLMKKFHDTLKEENKTLICVDKKLLDGSKRIDELEGLVKKAFVIKPIDSFTKEVRSEISGLKDQFITAILNGHLGEIEELSDIYLELAKGFLGCITECSGGYSFEGARKELRFPWGGWEEVGWLSSDIRDIFEKAMQSRDQEVIRKVAYLPIAIAVRAIESYDHYLFQEFINFAVLMYINSKEITENNRSLKDFLVDRSWRWLKEILLFYIEPKLRKEELDEEKLKRLKDFGIYLFIVFQRLLKTAFENRDLDSFKKFIEGVHELFSNFHPSVSLENTYSIKKKDIKKEITMRRNQMFFGLASWILDQLLKNKTEQKVLEFYQTIQKFLPSDIEEFTNLFIESYTFETEDFWSWDMWELEGREEGVMHAIQFSEKLEKLYIVKSLSLLANRSDEEILKIELPYNRTFAELCSENGDLINVLDDIKRNVNDWKMVLSDSAIKKIDVFKNLLFETRKKQEQEELKEKIRRKISQKKIEKFKEDVLKGFYENAVLRDIFRHYSLLEKVLDASTKGEKARFGINTVADKAMFFEDWYIFFDNPGIEFGRGIAAGEDLHLFNEIVRDCKEVLREDFDKALLQSKNLEDIIILVPNTAVWYILKEFKNFKPYWYEDADKLEVKGFSGWYDFNGQSIPVFETYLRQVDNQILILDKTKLGKIIQLSPLNEGEEEKLIEDIFYMDIQAFSENEELMEQFIKTPPKWLVEIGDGQKQKEYLQERVLIRIFERFELKKHQDFEGYKLSLKEDNRFRF
ncbi:MAG TPA: hypothetical protein DCG38_10495 [Eubacteriaceae bacterium]|nr:hypothetical protein [Eubacteriaceae bacterium]